MRTILLALMACLCSATEACESTAQTAIQPAAQPAAQPAHHPLRFGVIDRAPGPFRNPEYGFEMRPTDAMGIDSLFRVAADGKGARPNMHAWAFLQVPDPHEGQSAYWQRVVVNAARMPFNERVWTLIATDARRAALKHAPGAQVVEYVVQWRPDVSEYRVGVHDFAKDEFVNVRCLGSHVGRPRSVVVCVQTFARTAEALAAVRESLVLTPPDSATADK